MNKIKRDLPIYVLSAALVFLGISISAQPAGAALGDPPGGVTQSQFNSYKQCANNNFQELMFFSTSGNNRAMFIRTCR
jgi:hypothetical protein